MPSLQTTATASSTKIHRLQRRFGHLLAESCIKSWNTKEGDIKPNTPSVTIRPTEHLQFIYSLSEGYIVYLRPVGRPYSLFMARWKAVQFTLRTVSRTYGQLRTPFRRQPKRHLRRDFLRISFVFYGFIFTYFFYIFGFIKASYRGYTQAVLFFKYR